MPAYPCAFRALLKDCPMFISLRNRSASRGARVFFLFLFRPRHVGVKLWQLGQSASMFSCRWSTLSPLMWSTSNTSGSPSHSESLQRLQHLFCSKMMRFRFHSKLKESKGAVFILCSAAARTPASQSFRRSTVFVLCFLREPLLHAVEQNTCSASRFSNCSLQFKQLPKNFWRRPGSNTNPAASQAALHDPNLRQYVVSPYPVKALILAFPQK